MGRVYAQRSNTLIDFVLFWAGKTIKMFPINLRKLIESMNSMSECGMSQWHRQRHFILASE